MMNNIPDISIVIPVYNSHQYMHDCLESLLIQQGVTLEIIIVNDGSTDGTEAILREYANKYAHITVINQENKGSASARNRGMNMAQGEYLLFVDADDVLLHNSLRIYVDIARKEATDILQAGHYYCKSHSKKKYIRRLYPVSSPISGTDYFKLMQKRRTLILAPFNNFIRTEFLHSIPFQFDENLQRAQDMEFFAKVLLLAKRVMNTKHLYYIYNMNTSTGGAKYRYDTAYLFQCYEYIKERFYEFADRFGLAPEYKKRLDYLICTQAYNCDLTVLNKLTNEQKQSWKKFIKKYMFRNNGWLRPYIYYYFIKLIKL